MNDNVKKIEDNLQDYKKQLIDLKEEQDSLLSGKKQKVGLVVKIQKIFRKK